MKLYNTGNMKGHLSCYNILESLCKNGTCNYYSEEPVTAERKKSPKCYFLQFKQYIIFQSYLGS